MKKPTIKPPLRVHQREALDPRRSVMFNAGYILNKLESNRVHNRVLPDGHYYVMFVLSGHGVYDDPENGARAVKPGDAIVTFPGLPHSYSPKPVWDEAYIALSGAMFVQWEAEGLLRRDVPVLSPGLSPAIVSAVRSLVDDAMQERPLTNPVQMARVHLLLASIVEAHLAANAPQDGEFLRRACAFLEADLHRDVSFEAVAAKFGFGYERFRKLFAEQTGVSPARYRILRRIDRAKTLLLEGRTPLKLIAEQLGYCDVYFFARQFKQVTGKTPGEFRRY